MLTTVILCLLIPFLPIACINLIEDSLNKDVLNRKGVEI